MAQNYLEGTLEPFADQSSKIDVWLEQQIWGHRLYNDQTSSSDYGATVTASFIALIPVLLFFLVFQRFLVDGVATQGLKG